MMARISTWVLFFGALVLLTNAAPAKHKHKHSKGTKLASENGNSRSYIDIDASDPFKVPQNSKYVDQPMPTFNEDDSNKAEAPTAPKQESSNNNEEAPAAPEAQAPSDDVSKLTQTETDPAAAAMAMIDNPSALTPAINENDGTNGKEQAASEQGSEGHSDELESKPEAESRQTVPRWTKGEQEGDQ